MGGIAGKMVVEAMDALAYSDTVLAHEIVATDPRLDALQRGIEDMAVLTIARRQPVASDLRELIGAIRIVGDLERVSDLAKNIAKRTVKLGAETRVPRAIIGIKHNERGGNELLKDVLDAYAQRGEERAQEVRERDVDLDELPRSPEPRRHFLLRAPPVLLQEHRADRRPRRQHRRNDRLSRHWRADAG